MFKRYFNLLFLLSVLFFCCNSALSKDVIYNTKTGVIHREDCHTVQKCKHCEKMDLVKAIDIGNAKGCSKCRDSLENLIDAYIYKRAKRRELNEMKRQVRENEKNLTNNPSDNKKIYDREIKHKGNYSYKVKEN